MIHVRRPGDHGTEADLMRLDHDGPDEAPAPTEDLAHLLGPIRATILAALRTPTTMGDIARILGQRPSTVTYHCGLLEKAGLVRRVRNGPEVYVRLTDRGIALHQLMSAPEAA